MALEYHTGFDMIPTSGAYAYLKQMGWTHTDAGSGGNLSTTVVRNGTRSLKFASGGEFVAMANLANAATRVLGFGLYATAISGTQRAIAVVADGAGDWGLSGGAANNQVSLGVDSSGHLLVRRGQALNTSQPDGTLLATSTNALVAATWHFIEMVVTVHNSAGTVEVYVNGSKTGWIDATGLDTQQTANAYSNAFVLAADGALGNHFFDDVYTLTSTGAAPTGRLGDCKSVVKFAGTDAALGVGTYTDSTPSTGTDQGAMVDDNPTPDDDSTYNALTAAAQKDSYKTAPLGLTGFVHAATVRARLKKSDAGAGSAQVGLRSGSLDDLSADVFPSDTSYQWFSRLYPTDPNTSAGWTIPNLDAAQILVKRTL